MNTFHRLHSRAPGQRAALLGEALDRCLDDLLLRGRSVEQCLERWPQLRDELEPLLRVATSLSMLDAATEAPQPSAELRSRVMAELRGQPRVRAHRPINRPVERTRAFVTRNGAWRGAMAVSLAGLALAFVLFLPSTTPGARAATLSMTSGEVDVYVGGSWQPALTGAELSPGAVVRTGPDGRAQVELPAGAVLIEPGSVVRVSADQDGDLAVQLEAGRAWIDVPLGLAPEGAPLRVRTPFATFEARDASFEVALEPGRAVTLVDRGVIEAHTVRDTGTGGPGRPPGRPLGVGQYTIAGPPAHAAMVTVHREEAAHVAALTVAVPGASGVRLTDPGGLSTESGAAGARHAIPGSSPGDPEAAEAGSDRLIRVRSPRDGRWILVVEPGSGPDTVTFSYGEEEQTVPLPAAGGPVEIEFEIAPGEAGPRLRILDLPGRREGRDALPPGRPFQEP